GHGAGGQRLPPQTHPRRAGVLRAEGPARAAMTWALEVEGLSRSYGDFRAVQGLDFRVAAGEVLGLVGPNGAGKTTTLRCVAGILPPTAGVVRIGGHDVQKDA